MQVWVRMREGKLDLQLPLWGTSTQSTRCELSSLLAASPSWLCRSEKAVGTAFVSGASVKSLGKSVPNTVELGSRTEPELQFLLYHRPQAMISQENLTTASTPHGRELLTTFQLCQKHDCFSCSLSEKLHLSANTLQKSGSEQLCTAQEHWPACCSVLGRFLRAWKGLHYSPEAPSQSEGRGTLENYLITGQENKDSFRTIFSGLVSRTCFWVSPKGSCAHKKPGKHLTLQLTRHSQDSKELPLGGKQAVVWTATETWL